MFGGVGGVGRFYYLCNGLNRNHIILIPIRIMNRLLTAAALAAATLAASADDKVIIPDSTGFKFTDITTVKTTPVKDQNKSGTCWSFASTSLLEDEVLRKGGPETDISEMFTVRQCYIDKAKKFVRMNGKINFAQGGSALDVPYVLKRYGAMPEEAYAGLNYGEDKHSHYEMFDALDGYLRGILKKGNKNLSTAWLKGFEGILDAYLGPVPEKFTVNGKEYTPQSYAKSLGLDADDYVSITSFTHHPFYQKFPVEVEDNWLWAESENVPLNELKAITDYALEKGYPVVWSADVSEGGFKWRNGYAVLPEKVNTADMDGTELSRWVQLSDKDRDAVQYDIKGPVKEQKVTQESRQAGFDRFETTDDHGMELVGIAKDQEGNRYYKVKNSWDTNQLYNGFFYVSEPYFLAKTIGITLNKEAVPKDIAKKLGWK